MPFERMLAQDLEALVFLRVPQIPSSRAWGDYPTVTAWEYTARLPCRPGGAEDHSGAAPTLSTELAAIRICCRRRGAGVNARWPSGQC